MLWTMQNETHIDNSCSFTDAPSTGKLITEADANATKVWNKFGKENSNSFMIIKSVLIILFMLIVDKHY